MTYEFTLSFTIPDETALREAAAQSLTDNLAFADIDKARAYIAEQDITEAARLVLDANCDLIDILDSDCVRAQL